MKIAVKGLEFLLHTSSFFVDSSQWAERQIGNRPLHFYAANFGNLFVYLEIPWGVTGKYPENRGNAWSSLRLFTRRDFSNDLLVFFF